MQIEAMIRAVQRALGITVDGLAGPETWGAIYGALVGAEEPADIVLNETGDRTNARSEAVIATLLPQVQPYARALFFKARDHGIAINIISGLRTYAEQDALYAKGRTAPGRKVTNARGGYSNHNFGIAFDIGVFEGSRYLPSSSKYKAVGVLGQEARPGMGRQLEDDRRPAAFPVATRVVGADERAEPARRIAQPEKPRRRRLCLNGWMQKPAKGAGLFRASFPAANDSALAVDDKTGAAVVVIERRTVRATVLAGAALAKHGDTALFHQLPELGQRQSQAAGDQRAIDFDRRRGRL